MIWRLLLLLSALVALNATPLEKEDNTIGCLKCTASSEKKINVHLVPHSHDDVGWLKTVDEYYYGLLALDGKYDDGKEHGDTDVYNYGDENGDSFGCGYRFESAGGGGNVDEDGARESGDVVNMGVQSIITSVVQALSENHNRRFIQVETAYFWKWWKSQSDSMREKFKKLVDNGQIEMVNGAWSMNDEACTNYQSTIDQFTWGLKTLQDTLGKCGRPRVAWQIDPFGHSREQASIISQLGYDGVFFARLDHNDRQYREEYQRMDFAWQGSANIDDSIIFGSIFPTYLYMSPNGFCFDVSCTDDTIDDDKESPTYNLDEMKEKFKNYITEYVEFYSTNNVLIPMGGYFQYQAAENNYINMDRLIKGFKEDDHLNVFYSTPSCYIAAVNSANNTLSLKTDDFFPYSDSEHSFWTGYFSSRPTSKRFERTGHNILQVAKQLHALDAYHTNKDNSANITPLREAIGVMQHHDAISGTEKQAVADDYARMLTEAIEKAEAPLSGIINRLLAIDNSSENTPSLNFTSCPLSNMSICDVSGNSERFVVAVYNPLAWEITHYVRLPVENDLFEVNGPNGTVPYQLVPSYVRTFDFTEYGESFGHELVFVAKDLPPMGLRLYHITRTARKSPENEDMSEEISSLKNISPTTGSISWNGTTWNFEQNYYYYQGVTNGSNSGAYIFRPESSTPNLVDRNLVAIDYTGIIVDEYQVTWEVNLTQLAHVVRRYKDEDYIEFDWTVSDLQQGCELVSIFTINGNFASNGTFYTDSNGREMMRRERDVHPGYKYDPSEEPVSSNYYPVTSAIVLKDTDQNMGVAVLTDRSQGGSSMKDGQIELMIHRRLLKDDEKGVDEALNEEELGGIGIAVRGSHYLILGAAKSDDGNAPENTITHRARVLAQKKLNQPWIGLASTEMTYNDLKSQINFEYSAMNKSLPSSVNIISFEPWRDGRFLLRLEHIFEQEDVDKDSVEIDLQNLFEDLKITEIVETTLGANEELTSRKDRGKYSWNIDDEMLPTVEKVKDSSKMKISLTPMQIRTFEVTVGKTVSSGIRTTTKPVLLMFILATVFYISH